MLVTDGLKDIRERLIHNGASPKSVDAVDAVLKRASLPAAQAATAGSLLQLVRMLMRSPAANADPAVYDDFVQLEAAIEQRTEQVRIEREAEESRPVPKLKKYYKKKA